MCKISVFKSLQLNLCPKNFLKPKLDLLFVVFHFVQTVGPSCVCVFELDLLPFLYSLFSISVAPVPSASLSPQVLSAVAQRLSCRSSPVSTSRRGLCSLCLRSSPPVGSPLLSFAPLPLPPSPPLVSLCSPPSPPG